MSETVTKRVLLVEDESILAMNEKAQLEKYGYDVRTVTTGEKAVEAVQTSSDIDLILMDINLGNGIDGTQAAEVILKDHDIPIVFLSSHTDPEVVEKTEKITSYGYVVKNSNIAVIDASIKMAFKLFNANRERNESVRLMEKTTAHVPGAVYQYKMNSDGTASFPFSTKGIWDIFELTPEQLQEDAAVLSERTHPDDVQRVVDSVHTSYAGMHHWECDFRVVLPSKGERWIRGTANPEITENGVLWHGYFVDITDRKRAEEAVLKAKEDAQASEEQTRYILKHNPNAIAVFDNQMKFLVVSDRFLYDYNLQNTDIIGKNHYDVFPEIPERWKNVHQRALQGEILRNDDDHFVRPDGSVTYTRWECRPWYYPDTSIGGMIAYTEVVTEKKQAEAKYRSLFNYSNDAIFVHELGTDDLPGRNIDVNEQAIKLLGYTKEELLTLSAREVVPQERAAAMAHHAQELIEKKHLTFESENIRRDGSIIPIEVSAHLYTENSKRFVVSSVRDISRRKQAEAALAQKTKLLERAQVLANLGSWEWDIPHDTWHFSEQWKKIHGLSDDDLSTPKLIEIAHPDDAPGIEKAFSEATERGTTYSIEHRIIRADNNEIRYVKALGEVDFDHDTGRPVRMLGVVQDITEQKRAEQDLTERDVQLQAILDNSPWLISELDLDGRYLLVNPAVAAFFGLQPSQVIGRSFEELLPKEMATLFKDRIGQVRSSDGVIHVEDGIWTENGFRHYLTTLFPVRYNGKEFRSIGSIAYDVTDRKQAEEEIQKQLSEKETLLREGHHRVKNNIAMIESLLSLQIGDSDSPDVKAALEETITRVQSIRVLYEKLLISNDLNEISMRNYVESLLDSVAMVFDPERLIPVETHVADFEVDARKAVSIGMVINELLTNVFKYAFRDRQDGLVSLSIEKTADTVTLIVHDNGVGIDETIMKNESPGFGLTIVNMLVEQLNGTIAFANEGGTRVTLKFPITEEL